MSRNTNSRFALNPTNIDITRSKFSRSSSVKTSFDVGEIIPFYLDEVLPGDTFNIKTSKVVRLQTPLTPFMDNLYLDTYYFFVPNRLVWEHWKNFMGENTESAWIPQVEYQIPQVTAPEGGWEVGTIADYMGIPTGISNISVSALPFRAYALVMNEWFRDQNLCDPLNIPVDDTTIVGVNTGTFVTDVVKGGKPYIAAKYHDYFTSCLPAPQKGPDVLIPVGNDAPVFGNGSALGLLGSASGNNMSALVRTWPVVSPSSSDTTTNLLSYNTYLAGEREPSPLGENSFAETNLSGSVPSNNAFTMGVVPKEYLDQYKDSNYDMTGLYADLSLATGASVNALRTAFQIQKLYEKDARGGTRYIEILKAHFGVTSPDARLQRPEYLGGNRIPINVNQVVQTSNTGTDTTPQGNVAGVSVTSDSHSDFTRSFVEHGFVLGLMVVRYNHTYQQGLNRLWSRKDRFDYYWPVLANIGEQPVLNKEIYAQGNAQDDEVFGYQEAWADYRYKPSLITGEMRSTYATSLDSWHLGDDYSSLPMLSSEWIQEDSSTVDRVIAVSSRVSNQLFGDIYVQNYTTRAMPMYSIPGLIDHH